MSCTTIAIVKAIGIAIGLVDGSVRNAIQKDKPSAISARVENAVMRFTIGLRSPPVAANDERDQQSDKLEGADELIGHKVSDHESREDRHLQKPTQPPVRRKSTLHDLIIDCRAIIWPRARVRIPACLGPSGDGRR